LGFVFFAALFLTGFAGALALEEVGLLPLLFLADLAAVRPPLAVADLALELDLAPFEAVFLEAFFPFAFPLEEPFAALVEVLRLVDFPPLAVFFSTLFLPPLALFLPALPPLVDLDLEVDFLPFLAEVALEPLLIFLDFRESLGLVLVRDFLVLVAARAFFPIVPVKESSKSSSESELRT
jgi:hypothetical protein